MRLKCDHSYPRLFDNRRAGRPSMGEQRRTPTTVTPSPGLIAKVDVWAYIHDLSRSRVVEQAIVAWIKGDNDESQR